MPQTWRRIFLGPVVGEPGVATRWRHRRTALRAEAPSLPAPEQLRGQGRSNFETLPLLGPPGGEKGQFCPSQTARILEADEVDRSGVAVDPTRPASVHFWTGATSDHFNLL